VAPLEQNSTHRGRQTGDRVPSVLLYAENIDFLVTAETDDAIHWVHAL
jgi:hypothetical protein